MLWKTPLKASTPPLRSYFSFPREKNDWRIAVSVFDGVYRSR